MVKRRELETSTSTFELMHQPTETPAAAACISGLTGALSRRRWLAHTAGALALGPLLSPTLTGLLQADPIAGRKLADWSRYKLEGTTLASCTGQALERIAFRHPLYDRCSPVFLGDYVTLDTGTGVVHSAPAYGVEDFDSCRRYGMKDAEILTPVMGDGRYVSTLPEFGGLNIWKAKDRKSTRLNSSHT